MGRCGSPAAAEEGVGREGRALEAGEGGSARSRPSSSAEEGARIRYPDPLEHLEKLGAADPLELDADEAEVGAQRGGEGAGDGADRRRTGTARSSSAVDGGREGNPRGRRGGPPGSQPRRCGRCFAKGAAG